MQCGLGPIYLRAESITFSLSQNQHRYTNVAYTPTYQ